MTSSPHHHKLNGKVESAVKINESLFKKAFLDGKDPLLALSEYRNTPVETIGSSPAQRLMPDSDANSLNLAPDPRVVESIENKIKVKR